MDKNFIGWAILAGQTQSKNSVAEISEGEIWWCYIGANIGDEEDGKGEFFARPVLIVKKFNKNIFWGVPLTSQIQAKTYYHKISFQGGEQSVIISQLRTFDTKRLTSKIGQLSDDQYKKIRETIKELL